MSHHDETGNTIRGLVRSGRRRFVPYKTLPVRYSSLALVLYLVGVWLLTSRPTWAEDIAPSVAIIPRPAKIALRSGKFVLHSGVRIRTGSATISTGQYLADSLKAIGGWSLIVERDEVSAPHEDTIALRLDPGAACLGDEGYTLVINPQTVIVRAEKPAGLFYACQSLRQLLLRPAAVKEDLGQGDLPCLEIEDKPRFAWRGLMLDPARQFLDMQYLKRYIDMMAFYKLNRFHLHLTDTTAWTIEIKKYPELTDIKHMPELGRPIVRGFYSQADVRELVAYAASRFVMLVPEIELPSHNAIAGWVLADKVLCPNNPYRAHQKPWDERETNEWAEPCAANANALTVYEDILREVIGLFPAPYLHLGGDEYFGLAWAQCSDCQKLIERENLRRFETEELRKLFAKCAGNKEKYLIYRWLMTRMCDFVRSQGRRPMLWDDLAWRGQFPEGVVIVQWHYRGGQDAMQLLATPENPAVEAVTAGRETVIAPFSHLYFDLNSSLDDVYRFDPMPSGLTPAEQARVLGPHALVWNQRQEQVEGRTFPRAYALAEIGWSPLESRDRHDFGRRLAVHQQYQAIPKSPGLPRR
jgi:hexosaminidase